MRLRGTVQKRPAQRISLSDKPRRKFRAVSFVAAVMAAVLTASAGIGAYAADAETVPPIKYTVIEAESEDAAEGTIEQAPDPDAIKGARIPEEKEPSKETEKTADKNTSEDSQGGEEAGGSPHKTRCGGGFLPGVYDTGGDWEVPAGCVRAVGDGRAV